MTGLATVVVPEEPDTPAFQLCPPCARRLQAFALRPLEWYRLAVMHGPFAYLLHDDFYDEDGRASAPELPVTHAALFPAPTLGAVASDPSRLVDHAFTRWWLRDEVVVAPRRHEAGALLPLLTQRMDEPRGAWLESRCYEIAAALGPAAGGWVDAHWNRGVRRETLSSFLQAAAACLPVDNATPRAIAAVDQLEHGNLTVVGLSPAEFRSPLVLD